ncbi:MAG: PQQ-binding-like beta-propeller repeat protein [Thaumarchaeota archaeon]|nr:PQQ-binding-like beta-propeller repeat protein [Nitrososphaerota archaeon]
MQNQQNTGYSPQTIINQNNVGQLQLAWSTDVPGDAGTPVIWNSLVFITGGGAIRAVNETTGHIVWVADKNSDGLDFSTRVGVTIDAGDVFAATFSSQLVSLNATTGAVNWVVSVTSGIVGSMVTYDGPQATPLVYDGKVIVGETSGDVGARGVVRAFSENNGALLWTFYTVPPAPMNSTNQAAFGNTWGTNGTNGCQCAGGAVWNVPAVDPHTGIIYFATGNPYPLVKGYDYRTPNDADTNLCTDCVIGVNSTNGQMVWYFQEVPHDWGDHDEGMPVQLFNTTINGVQTEVVGDAGKAGYYFELNAHTGAPIYKVKVGIHLNENLTSQGLVYPGADGGVDTLSSYDPKTSMIYTMAWNSHQICKGNLALNTMRCVPQYTGLNSTLYGIDASTGTIVWNMNMSGYGGGVSSTNDIVFTSDGNHNFYALNAMTGAILWQHNDPSGGSQWNWGPPSITNGMVFETTLGNTSTGRIEAYAIVPSSISVMDDPFGVTHDTANDLIYVANYGSGSVSVISDARLAVLTTIDVGSEPMGIAYDSANGYLYVTNSGSDTVSVISGLTNQVVGTVSVGSSPQGAAYDPKNGRVYVTNTGSNSVSTINGTQITGSPIPVGSKPYGIAFGANQIYVANSGSNTVSVISPSLNDKVSRTISVGSSPTGVAYDSANKEVYVTNSISDSVSAISTTSKTVVATIAVGESPYGVVYDTRSSNIYVTNTLSATYTEIAGSSNTVINTVSVGFSPTGIAFVSITDRLYVADNETNSVYYSSAT